jgi:hypothetical protein
MAQTIWLNKLNNESKRQAEGMERGRLRISAAPSTPKQTTCTGSAGILSALFAVAPTNLA